jgi:hypothetical protein
MVQDRSDDEPAVWNMGNLFFIGCSFKKKLRTQSLFSNDINLRRLLCALAIARQRWRSHPSWSRVAARS